ncbi:phage terminase large subunit family protein [Edwardsiella ictaluri]|nr:phage terminase large subunit family protein [Edwardsiella ictaluri]ELV7528732.1 phage terminase large subunit family protein [Edwardsiella ictaluri]
MNISTAQLNNLVAAINLGLSALYRPPVQTAAEWMDENYYLPVESSYQEGRWRSIPFQVAIINAMANDDIREVNLVKSARVGYTKILLGVAAYLLEHKKRNGLIWQPTDSDAELFVKKHVEPMIRDVPKMRAISPWLGKKHRDNTLDLKRFANGRGLEVRGERQPRITVRHRLISVSTMSWPRLIMILKKRVPRHFWGISGWRVRPIPNPFVVLRQRLRANVR